MRTHARTSLLVLLAALVLSGCGQAAVPRDAVASVNGEEIPADLFERLVTAQVNNPGSALAEATGETRVEQIESLQRQILTQLIRTEIVSQAAVEYGIEVTDQEVEGRFEQEVAFRGSPEDFAMRLAELGYTEEDARRILRSVLLQQKFEQEFTADVDVSEEELRAVYEERKAIDYQLADVSHILVETEAEAKEILDLLEGGADFAELAEERSIDEVSAAQGGSLGRAPRGAYVEAFDEAVWNAEEGELVGPVQTQFGFHIIRVEEFVEIPFEEAREEIRSQLVGQTGQGQLQARIQELFRNADVSVDSRFGRYDPESGQVVAPDTLGS